MVGPLAALEGAGGCAPACRSHSILSLRGVMLMLLLLLVPLRCAELADGRKLDHTHRRRPPGTGHVAGDILVSDRRCRTGQCWLAKGTRTHCLKASFHAAAFMIDVV